MRIYDIFSSYDMSIYSYIMQAMLMSPTNPAYLYAFQNRSLLLACRMLLCFQISTIQLILLQNHPFLVSCEFLKMAILLYFACFLSLCSSVDNLWCDLLRLAFSFKVDFCFLIAEKWKQSLVTFTLTLTRNCCRFVMACPQGILWVR
jgi:hypothetical protein